MSEKKYEAKQSKRMVVIACCSAGIFLALFLALLIFFSIKLTDIVSHDERIAYILCIIIWASFIAVILIILIYLIYIYNKQTDIYLNDKFVRLINGKVIFEVPYANIESIREGIDSLFMTLKTPIVKCNGKKGPRNFYEHYSRAAIHRIKQIITDKYFNIPFI